MSTPSIPQVVIYNRVSSTGQEDNYSLSSQADACNEYAKAQGWQVVDVLQEVHTGEEIGRPVLQGAMTMVKDGKADILLCHDLDRLSRSLEHLMLIERHVAAAGGKIDYVKVSGSMDPNSKLLRYIKGLFAGHENEQKSERTRRGVRKKVMSGKVHLGTRTPYGYDRNGNELIVDEQQAEAVRLMYGLCIEGKGQRKIAAILTESGYPTKGDLISAVPKKALFGEWNHGTVGDILRAPVNKGDWVFGRTRMVKDEDNISKRMKVEESEWLHVEVPAIVDASIWQRAQESLTGRKVYNQGSTKQQYLLQGMLRCSCGRVAKCFAVNQKYRYYECPTTYGNGRPCGPAWRIRADVLDAEAWSWVVGRFLSFDGLNGFLDGLQDSLQEHQAAKEEWLSKHAQVIDETQGRLERLHELYIDGVYPRSEYDNRRAKLERAAIELEPPPEMDRWTMNHRVMLDGWQHSDPAVDLGDMSTWPKGEFPLQDTPAYQAIREAVAAIRADLAGNSFEDKRSTLHKIGLRVDIGGEEDQAKGDEFLMSAGLNPAEWNLQAPEIPNHQDSITYLLNEPLVWHVAPALFGSVLQGALQEAV